MNKEWQIILDKVAKQLHDGTMTPGKVSPDMIRAHAEELFKAVAIGFDAADAKKDINQYTQLQALRENVYVFSGFKNYQQLKEMSLLLTDSNGNIRSFNDFKNDVLAVDKTYNKTYLQAEYNHAISSSTMIAKWQKFKAEADIFPLLRYRTVGDNRVRQQHEKLNDITLPIEDDFWNIYFPPNDWGCRCDAEQVEGDSKAAPSDLPTLKPMFRSNVGKEGIIFPDTHPYFKIKADNELPQSNIKNYITNTSLLSMPIEEQWILLKEFKNGGKILKHVLVDENSNLYKKDYNINLEIAGHYSSKGKTVKILPNLNGFSDLIIESTLPGKKNKVFPDLKFDEIYVEIESIKKLPFGKHTITNAIGKGAKQAEIVVVTLPKSITKSKMYRLANGRFKTHAKLQEIIFKYKKSYVKWSRDSFKSIGLP